MEFGKLEDITNVNWQLPEDDPKNSFSDRNPGEQKVYFGSPAWAVKHWRGKIYPRDCDPGKFLFHYSRNFTCIELNTTHYRIPTPETVKEWRAEVPGHFHFCPKVPQKISHSRTGILDPYLLNQWYEFLESLGENSGPSFIQFHENFSYSEKMVLFKFLETWPKEFELTLELRHSSWFQNKSILPALTDYLRKKGIGLVITDVAGRRDVLHSSVTTDWTMIRLIGNDLDSSDELRLRDWGKRLQDWNDRGPKRIYLFLHQPDDIWTIEFARAAKDVFTEMNFKNLPSFPEHKPRDLFNLC